MEHSPSLATVACSGLANSICYEPQVQKKLDETIDATKRIIILDVKGVSIAALVDSHGTILAYQKLSQGTKDDAWKGISAGSTMVGLGGISLGAGYSSKYNKASETVDRTNTLQDALQQRMEETTGYDEVQIGDLRDAYEQASPETQANLRTLVSRDGADAHISEQMFDESDRSFFRKITFRRGPRTTINPHTDEAIRLMGPDQAKTALDKLDIKGRRQEVENASQEINNRKFAIQNLSQIANNYWEAWNLDKAKQQTQEGKARARAALGQALLQAVSSGRDKSNQVQSQIIQTTEGYYNSFSAIAQAV